MAFSTSSIDVSAWVSPYISLFTREGPFAQRHNMAGFASATYPAANRAYYWPIQIPIATTVSRFFWANGATASTNNVQMGLYNEDFTAHTLGTSTLAAGASVCQFDNVTDFVVHPGRYWLALWCSGTTTTLARTINSSGRSIRCFDEDSLTGGLPSTATPTTASIYFVLCGMTTIST